MEFRRRVLLLEQHSDRLPSHFGHFFVPGKPSMPPPLCPPPPFPEHGGSDGDKDAKRTTLEVGMVIMACMLGTVFVLGILLKILRTRHERRRQRSRNVGPFVFATQENFLDGDQGPQLDHPIWYINTVGLQQSVIDSIMVFKYKKDETLIEGTECSVCLSEFEEDESLRLLPKCSHAFHILCIDTWLRSHKNCPLCRAPIVNANIDAQVSISDLGSSSSSSSVESQTENSETEVEDGTREVRNGDGSADELQAEDETDGGNHSKVNLDNILTDLGDKTQEFDAEMNPIRRSISADISSAPAIYSAVADAADGITQARDNQRNISKSKITVKRGSGGSMSFRKLMKSSTIGFSLQKEPDSMKRSFSSSYGNCSSSRNSRNRDSILPL